MDVNDLIVESPLGLEPYRPHLRYCLIDEGAYNDSTLAELKNLVAALFRLENNQNEENIYAALRSLGKWLASPEQLSLQRSFAIWINEVLFPSCYPDATPPNIHYEQEDSNMLNKTIDNWYNGATAIGRAEGEAIGRAKGEAIGRAKGKAEGKAEGEFIGEAKSLVLLLKTKFSNLDQTQEESIYALPKESIEQAMTYIFQATSLDDMFTYIASLEK